MIPSIKQCENWLIHKYGVVINTNVSGCSYFGFVKGDKRKTGFPDKFIERFKQFIEIKRGDESFKPGQVEWLKRIDGLVYRFWEDHVDVYNSDIEIIGSIKYNDEA